MAVLSNNGWLSPERLAFQIAALVMGRPYQEPAAIELEPDVLTRYEGVYEMQGWDGACIRIMREGSRLCWQFKENEPEEILALSSNEFFFKENSFDHLHFESDANGRMIRVEMRWRAGMTDTAIRVDDPA